MFHMFPETWLIGRSDPIDERHRMHLAAIREAKLATEYRSAVAATAGSVAPNRRIALATSGSGSDLDLAACCA